jgi:hypothetical protein
MMIMKQRSKLSTLVSLATAMDVNFSLFDALDEAEASAKRQNTMRKASATDLGRSARTAPATYAR